MNDERKLSIYIAERYVTDTTGDVKEGGYYHAFLMLMDETYGNEYNARVVQQMHFNDDGFSFLMRPEAREGISSPERLEELDLFPYVSGSEADILQMWNHGMEFARQVKNDGIRFDKKEMLTPQGNNCRAGVKATIHAMGMTYSDEFAKSAAGTKAQRMHAKDVFSFENTDPDTPLAKLWAKNAYLLSELEPPPKVQIMTNPDHEALEAFFS